MKSPCNNDGLEYIRFNLNKALNDDEYALNLFELAKKCNLFTCYQLIDLLSEIDNTQIRILIIVKLFGNVFDRSNFNLFKGILKNHEEFNSLIKLINKNYDSSIIYIDDENYMIYKRCIGNLENDVLCYVKKLRELEILESEYEKNSNIKSTNSFQIDENSISEKDLDKIIKIIIKKDYEKTFKSIRSFIGIKTLSVKNAIEIIKNIELIENESPLIEFIIAIYPCLNDPHNIEILLKKITLIENQDECRVKLIKLPNNFFDINGEDKNTGCCNIF
jgi:hypothetical protein